MRQTVVSVSGGQSSAYIAANFPADHLLFALVTVADPALTYPDPALRKVVSDKIGREFIGTPEDDIIIHTILDLEQMVGKEVTWVVGKEFDKLRNSSLPNIAWRHCTTEMKIRPMFKWWKKNIGEPVQTMIGFRSGEEKRAKGMLDNANEDGLVSYNKTPWQQPIFPLIDNGVRRDHVKEFWKDKPVRFARLNNCVGCFHRSPLLLRKMFDEHPTKMDWFERMESMKNAQWKSEVSYTEIRRHNLQHELSFDDFNECDSGYCGL